MGKVLAECREETGKDAHSVVSDLGMDNYSRGDWAITNKFALDEIGVVSFDSKQVGCR